jgi:hypothetical protein
MSRARIIWCALAALVFLAGCDRDEVLRKFASPADEKVARQCIDTMRHGRLEEIEASLEPGLKGAQAHAQLLQMMASLPPREPDAVKLVGASQNFNNGVRSSNLTYQYSYGTQHFMINCAWRMDGERRVIFGMEVKPLAASLEETSRFDLQGKSALQYGVLIGALVCLGMSLLALILCIMEKGLRRKWLWILFILFGIGQLSVDWNSGAQEFSPLHLLLFSASAVSPGYGPWVVSIAFPLGAAWYLARRVLNHWAADRSNGA